MIEIRVFQKIVDPRIPLDIPLLMVDSGEVAAVVLLSRLTRRLAAEGAAILMGSG